MYLLDASSIVKACVERTPLTHSVTTISLALYEAFNAVLMMVRRGILNERAGEIVASYLSRVLKEIEVLDLEPEELLEVFYIAKKLNLTIYDTAYLYTARKRGYILVTEDTELREKASQQGVEAVNLDKITKSQID